MTAMSKVLQQNISPAQTQLAAAGEPLPQTARVLARAGRDVVIALAGGSADARVAFSCLVQPEPDDVVAVREAAGLIYIVAILERASAAPTCLLAQGDLSIVSAQGDISLTAARHVQLGAAENVQITACEIGLHAGVARFVLDELQQIGKRAVYYVGQIRSVTDILENFAGHILTRARNITRFVEESDQLRAGDVDHRAEGTLQLQARTAFITADKLVRMDAEQIHMG
jgi:Protein of unknown function (DUF3540)